MQPYIYYFVFMATRERKEVVIGRECFPTLQTKLQIMILIFDALKLFLN